ncbi:MAG: thermonuclease family protein [Pseudomonadota bacterium]|nr:thermonuclease family protein [Pseudomonadota bacterium]
MRGWKTWLVWMALACCCMGGPGQAAERPQPWAARVTHVSDGDTLWVQPMRGGRPRKIRLDGVDAPEICQPYGVMARDRLAQQVAGRMVQVLPRRHDDYGRLLARVSVQGQDMGRWMVRQGHAWSHRYRGQPGPYASLEARARAQRLGLWQSAAEMPRQFRQRHGRCH